MQFDDILIQLGQFGKYQRIQYFLLCLPGILCAFHQLAAVFLSATPDFRCKLPLDVYNGSETFKTEDVEYLSLITEHIKSKVPTANKTALSVIKSCQFENNGTCSSFVYSQDEILNSVVTEWDLVCGKAIQATISSSVYMTGVLVGAFTFGILSDLIGRKKTLLLCVFLQGCAGIACAFAPEYYSFVVLRFLTGAASMGLFMTEFVLGMELIGPKYRLAAGIIIQYFFAIGYVLLTGIAYIAKEWKYIQIAMSVPSFIFLVYFWVVPESARWLLSKGRTEEAEQIIQNAAKWNNVTLPSGVFDSLDDKPAVKEKVSAILKSKTLLTRSAIIFFNWCVVSMGYYGLSMNSGSLGGSIFVNFMLGGLVEFPAYTVCFATNKTGRKAMHVTGMMIGGLACLGTVLVDLYLKGVPKSTLSTYFVVLNMIGKFGMTIGFCIIYLWSAEIFPTSLRNTMMGFSSTLARVGSIAAPFIADIGNYVPEKYKTVLPASIFGSLVIVGGLLAIALPETTGHSMPETIDEANRFPNHNRDKYGQSTEVFEKSTTDLIDEKSQETKFH